MVHQNGPPKWSTKMVHQNGPPKWSTKMVHQNGPPKWSSKMVLQNGPPAKFFFTFRPWATLSALLLHTPNALSAKRHPLIKQRRAWGFWYKVVYLPKDDLLRIESDLERVIHVDWTGYSWLFWKEFILFCFRLGIAPVVKPHEVKSHDFVMNLATMLAYFGINQRSMHKHASTWLLLSSPHVKSVIMITLSLLFLSRAFSAAVWWRGCSKSAPTTKSAR